MFKKKLRQMFLFVLTGRRECMTVVWAKNPHFKLLGKHVYVFISKQWVQNIYYWALCSINKNVYFRMERFANPALKGNVFLLCQANLKLKSKLAEAIEKHNTAQGGRNAAVCKTHTLHIDKICTKQQVRHTNTEDVTLCLLWQLTWSDGNVAMLAHISSLMPMFHARNQTCV